MCYSMLRMEHGPDGREGWFFLHAWSVPAVKRVGHQIGHLQEARSPRVREKWYVSKVAKLANLAGRRSPLAGPRLDVALRHHPSVVDDQTAIRKVLRDPNRLEHHVEFVEQHFVGEPLALDLSPRVVKPAIHNHPEQRWWQLRVGRLEVGDEVVRVGQQLQSLRARKVRPDARDRGGPGGSRLSLIHISEPT